MALKKVSSTAWSKKKDGRKMEQNIYLEEIGMRTNGKKAYRSVTRHEPAAGVK